MSQTIDLDENLLGTNSDDVADHELGARLRTLKGQDPIRFTVNTVLELSKAAWVIRKQYELSSLLQLSEPGALRNLGFIPSDDYGSALSPAYQKGYELAKRTRELLSIAAGKPIDSLKELIEIKLGIPVVQLELYSDLAGATLASRQHRGIAINLLGDNASPLVRRMTLAHELGHLLWDVDSRLKKVVVDRYDQIETTTRTIHDHVEQRANAFAIEFIAPGEAISSEFVNAQSPAQGIENIVKKYGVSKTAAVRHLSNVSYGKIDASNERVGDINTDDWEGRESLAVPLFLPQDVPTSRRGRFANCVLHAFENGLISADSAAALYGCKPSDLSAALSSTRNYVTS